MPGTNNGDTLAAEYLLTVQLATDNVISIDSRLLLFSHKIHNGQFILKYVKWILHLNIKSSIRLKKK